MSRTFAALTIASDAVIAPNKPATSSNPSESFTMPPPDIYFFDDSHLGFMHSYNVSYVVYLLTFDESNLLTLVLESLF